MFVNPDLVSLPLHTLRVILLLSQEEVHCLHFTGEKASCERLA